MRNDHAEQGCRPDLGCRAGQDDTLDGQQVFKVEVEAHAEHEQDDADFRALGSRVRIGDEAGGVGAYNNACQQVTHNGGHAQFLGDESEHEGCAQATGKRQDEIDVMQHRILCMCGCPFTYP